MALTKEFFALSRVGLTDEEIQKVHDSLYEDGKTPEEGWFEHGIASAQLKKIAEWGNEMCIEHSNDMWHRRECPKCWQALLEEVKE